LFQKSGNCSVAAFLRAKFSILSENYKFGGDFSKNKK